MPSLRAHPVAVLNRSTVLPDADASRIVKALQMQASRDFAPVWGIDARLSFLPTAKTTGWEGKWNLVILDDSDTANALGYHDLTPEGLPVGKVFAKTVQFYRGLVSVTASHELLEMLLDPFISLAAEDPARNVFVAYEACDAVEADRLSYAVEGQQMSDFVMPAFFDPTSRGRTEARYSFCGSVYAPFELAAGGYELMYVPGRGWVQRVAKKAAAASDRPRVGSRRERRATPTSDWEPSIA